MKGAASPHTAHHRRCLDPAWIRRTSVGAAVAIGCVGLIALPLFGQPVGEHPDDVFWDDSFILAGTSAGRVFDLEIDSAGHPLIVGDFKQVGSLEIEALARWDGIQWTAAVPTLPERFESIRSVELDSNGRLFVWVWPSSRWLVWDKSGWRDISNVPTELAISTQELGRYITGTATSGKRLVGPYPDPPSGGGLLYRLSQPRTMAPSMSEVALTVSAV